MPISSRKEAVVNRVEIRRMSRNDMDEACRVIGLAFADNPNSLVVAGGDRGSARRIMQASVRVAKLGRTYSYVLVAEEAGRIIGVLKCRGLAALPDVSGREAPDGAIDDPSDGPGAPKSTQAAECVGEA